MKKLLIYHEEMYNTYNKSESYTFPFAIVLTAGFYCDSRAHNARKVRVVKYIVVYSQIKAADQKFATTKNGDENSKK